MFVLEEFAEKNVEDDENEQTHEDEREVFDVHWYFWEIIIYVYNVENEMPLITKKVSIKKYRKQSKVCFIVSRSSQLADLVLYSHYALYVCFWFFGSLFTCFCISAKHSFCISAKHTRFRRYYRTLSCSYVWTFRPPCCRLMSLPKIGSFCHKLWSILKSAFSSFYQSFTQLLTNHTTNPTLSPSQLSPPTTTTTLSASHKCTYLCCDEQCSLEKFD